MKIFYNSKFLLGFTLLVAIIISFQSYYQGPKTFGGIKDGYTHYNNYLVFKNSFHHLLEGKNLYVEYPAENWDLYKYSPAFALMMAPFSISPNLFGLAMWNLLNMGLLMYAFLKFPFKNDKYRLLAFLFIFLEALLSSQNQQSNCLIAGLILMAYLLLEKDKLLFASLLIVLTVFIKLFGIISLALLLLYPNKIKSVLYTIFWTAFLAFLPLIFIPWHEFVFQYKNWLGLLLVDQSVSYGLSFMAFLQVWFSFVPPKTLVMIIGAVILLLPLIRYKQLINENFRLFFLSSILMWLIIFNYKAESSTLIIAVAGIAIWYFTQEKKTANLILLLLTLVFTILSSTDIFPGTLRRQIIDPYLLKTVPIFLIWFKLQYDLWLMDNGKLIIDNG